MDEIVLLALFTKLLDERLAQLPNNAIGPRGPRGPEGAPGQDGKDFNFAEHEEQIKSWAKEFALKFEDLSKEQLESLRGQKGEDGKDGQFHWTDENQSLILSLIIKTVKDLSAELKLKYSDLTAEEIESLRGPRGRDGKEGKGFYFDEHRKKILDIVKEVLGGMSESLKLRFSDLSDDDINLLRGPRGRDGRDGRDFNFDEHRDFFNGLKLKFSDLTEEERESLKLHFSQLTEEEKAGLKLRFTDLTEDDKAHLRGPRGPRGQKGSSGKDGLNGERGPRGPSGLRGLPGLTGPQGARGIDGADGQDGQDAPYVVAINVDQNDDQITFIFDFSDGSFIKTDPVDLPQSVKVLSRGGGIRGAGMPKNHEVQIDDASATVTYIGKTAVGGTESADTWQIQKITVTGNVTKIEWADGNDKFDNVWDNRASLSYA